MRKNSVFKILIFLFCLIFSLNSYSNNELNPEDCSHNFVIDKTGPINISGHTLYCTKCNLQKEEEHIFLHTYDSIANNQCLCGFNKEVNVSIYDEFNNLIIMKKIPSYSVLSDDFKTSSDKIGYITFYNEYEYAPKDNDYNNTEYNWIKIENYEKLPDKVNNLSLKFIAKYVRATISEIQINKNLIVNEIPVTANFKISKSASKITDISYWKERTGSEISGNRGTSLSSSGNSFTISDEKQNIATYDILKFKMSQDDDYYFFNYDIKYESNFALYDSIISLADGSYQKINTNALMYLADKSNSEIAYSYSSSLTGSASIYKSILFTFSGTNDYDNLRDYSNFTRTDTISLKINEKSVTQKMVQSHPQNNNVYNNSTYTKTDTGSTFSAPYISYCSLIFPFEKYYTGNVFGDNIYWIGNNFVDINYSSIGINLNWYDKDTSSKFREVVMSQILFKHNQENYIIPQRLNYDAISQSVTCDSTKNYWNNRIRGTIKIKKTDINNYRYLNMYCPDGIVQKKSMNLLKNAVSSNSDEDRRNNTNPSYDISYISTCPAGELVANSFHSDSAIDLLQYTHCDHNWIYIAINGNNQFHKVKCLNCEWEREENHDYKYEYDGLLNNMCICGANKQVNHIYDLDCDGYGTIQETLDVGSRYATYSNLVKTGYKFKNFKHYEKRVIGTYSEVNTRLRETYIGEVTNMLATVSNLSTRYVANYEPIKYNVKFHTENNKGLSLTLTFNVLNNISYGNTYDFPKANLIGYAIRGWTTTRGSSNIEYFTKDRLKNLTYIEGETIDLYPIIDYSTYTFKISTISNTLRKISTEISDLVCTYNTKYYLPDNIDIDGYTFLGWSKTYRSTNVDLIPNAEIYNYTNEDEKTIVLYPVYKAHTYKIKISTFSNINRIINEDIEDQYYIYDIGKILPEHVNIAGYNFKGWTLTKGSSDIDFGIEEKIINLTSIQDEVITLYPVYNNIIYQVNCLYEQDKATSSIILNVAVDISKELPKIQVLPVTKKGYGWFYNNNKVERTLDLDNFIMFDNQEISVFYKMEEGASAYITDSNNYNVKYQIEYKYPPEDIGIATNNINKYLSKVVDVEIGSDAGIYNLDYLKINLDSKNGTGFYYNNQKIVNTKQLDPYINSKDDKITLVYNYIKFYGSISGSSGGSEKTKEGSGPSGVGKSIVLDLNKNIEDPIMPVLPVVPSIVQSSILQPLKETQVSQSSVKLIKNKEKEEKIVEETKKEETEETAEVHTEETKAVAKATISIIEESKDTQVQGFSKDPYDLFYDTYGIRISKDDYSSNHSNVETKEVTKRQVFLMTLSKYRIGLIIALLLGIGGLALYVYYQRTNGYAKKKKK